MKKRIVMHPTKIWNILYPIYAKEFITLDKYEDFAELIAKDFHLTPEQWEVVLKEWEFKSIYLQDVYEWDDKPVFTDVWKLSINNPQLWFIPMKYKQRFFLLVVKSTQTDVTAYLFESMENEQPFHPKTDKDGVPFFVNLILPENTDFLTLSEVQKASEESAIAYLKENL